MPSPPTLRSDAAGLFGVLVTVGLAYFIAGPTDAVRRALDPTIQAVWAADLVVFGLLGIVGALMPHRLQVLGYGLEMVARVAVGLGSLVYALSIFYLVGWHAGRFVILAYGGIAGLLLVGAFQIARWLCSHRRAVSRVLKAKGVK